MACALQRLEPMASGLRLVWSSSPPRRAPGPAPLRAGRPPARATVLARELVDDWVGRSFEDGAEALDDLVERIAEALERRPPRVVLPVADVEIAGPAPGSS